MKALALVLLMGCGAPIGMGTDGGGTAGVVGMGPSGATDTEQLSGSRLKNRYLQGEDGSRSPLGFFDVQRNEPCSFVTADDGRQRCLPFNDAAIASAYFYDSACTQRVALSACAAKYSYEFTIQCAGGFTMYPLTQYTPSAGQLFVDSTGPVKCLQATAPPGTTFFYRRGAKIPASSFVAADVKVDP